MAGRTAVVRDQPYRFTSGLGPGILTSLEGSVHLPASTSVLIDARMTVRGLGISTVLDRLVQGFASYPRASLTLWRGSAEWGWRARLATLARSGAFDVAPGLDPRARGFDAVHFLSNISSIFPGHRTVLTVHDLLYRQSGRRRDRLLGFLLEQGLPRAGRVVAVSGNTRAEIEAGWPRLAGRVEVIPHGMRRLPWPTGDRLHLLAFSGGTDPRKRTDLMLEVYRRYREATRDPLPLMVLSRAGVTRSQLHQMTGLGATAIPDASGADVDRLVASAAAVLYTTSAEGFGLPIVEAGEVGTPVVMDADAVVAAEVLGHHCVRVTGSDPADWAVAVQRAVAVGPIRDALSLPSWESVAGRYLELYREVAAV